MLVEIRNWEKYNPRNDAKAWSWFRFQDNFFEDEDIWDLSQQQQLLLVYLFTRRSKAAKLTFRINPRQTAETLRTTPDAVAEGIRAIAAAGLIIVHQDKPDVRERTDPYGPVRERTDPVSPRTDPCPTDGRTDETDDISPPVGGPPLSPWDLAMAERWAEWAKTVSRTVKPHPEKWARVFRLLREKDGFTEAEIEQAFEHAKADSFWSANVASAEGLRSKSKNGLKKFENLLRGAQSSGKRQAAGASKPKQEIPVITEVTKEWLYGE